MLTRIIQSILILLFVVWTLVGSSHGSMFAEVCEKTATGEQNCASYNIFFYAAWQIIEFLNHYSILITAIATGLIAYFTLTLKRATDKLWDAGERQLGHLTKTTKRELRAYVSVEPCGINRFIGKSYVIGHIRIHNVGRIPARNVSIVFTIEHEPDQNGDRASFEPSEPKRTEIVLQPRAAMEFGSPKGWPLPEGAGKDNPLDLDGYLFVWGRVTYTDEFKTDGWTNFCHRYPCPMFGKGEKDIDPHSIHQRFARIHTEGGNTAN